MHKQWKINKIAGGDYFIAWRWSDSRGTMYNYYISGRKWKTQAGAEKWGIKHFNSKPNAK